MNRVLITGSTGMLGSHLVERMMREGVRVRALVRPGSDTQFLQSLAVEQVQFRPTDLGLLRKATEGVQIVFHMAGRLSVGAAFGGGRDAELLYQSDLELTKALLEAALDVGTAKFVYASSTSVYSPDNPTPIDEEAPLHPRSAYSRLKLMSEALIQKYQKKGIKTTVIRPCVVYGPRDRYFMPTVRALVKLPLLPLIDGGRYRQDLVYVGDVVDLIFLAGFSDAASGRVYNAASGDPLPIRRYLEILSNQLGRGPRVFSIKRELAAHLAAPARWYMRWLAPGSESLLTPLGLDYLSRDVFYDMKRAKEELGFQSSIKFPQGLALTLNQEPLALRASSA